MEKLKIVISRQNSAEAHTLRDQLERLGHVIVGEAQDVPRTQHLVHETDPDIALLEGSVLGINGLTIVQTLKEQHALPVIVLSVRDDPELALQAHTVGAAAYLALPASDGELTWALNAAISDFRDREELHRLRAQLAENTPPATQAISEKVINTIQALIVGLNPDGSIALFNDHCERVTGWRREEVLGKDWATTFIPERNQPPLRPVFQELLEGVDKNEYEHAILTRSGAERIIAWRNTALRDAGGQTSLILATGIDTTERRQAEDILYPLNAAALAAQRTLDPQKIFDIIARKLSTMGLGCTVMLADESQETLEIAFTTISSKTLAAAEELLGQTAIGFTLTIEQLDALKTICHDKRAVLGDDVAQVERAIRQALPEDMAGLAKQMTDALDIPPLIAAPMVASKELLGVLIVHAPGLSEPHVPAVTAFAYQLAIALENARLFEAERAQARRQAALSRLSAELAATLNTDQICRRVVKGLHDTLNYNYVSLLLLDETTNERVLVAHAGRGAPPPDQWRIPPGQGLSERPLLDGQAHYTADVSLASRYVANINRVEVPVQPTGSELDVPIRLGEKTMGVLVVESEQTDAFFQDDIEMIVAAANQTAVAIENARLFEAEAQRRQEAETLREVTTALTSTLDPDKVLDLILARLRTVVPYESSAIGLMKDDLCYLAAANDRPRAERLWGKGLSPDRLPLVARVLRERKAVIVADTHQLDNWVKTKGSERIRSWLGVPLVVKDNVIGLLMLNHTVPGFYTQESGRLAAAFAQQAALAIENARLFEETQAALTKTKALYRTVSSLIGSENLHDLLQSAVDRVAEALPADRVTLIILDIDEQQVIHIVERKPDASPAYHASFDELQQGLNGWVLHELEPALSPKGIPDPRESPEVQQRRVEMHAGDLIVVPLLYQGEVRGTLTAVSDPSGRDFTPQDAELLMALGNQATLAIENAQLHEAQRQQADELARLHRATAPLFLTTTSDLPTLTQNIVEAVLREFGQANCSLFLLDPENGELERIGAVGPYTAQVTRARLTLDGPGLVPWALRTGQPVNVPNVLTHPDYVANWDQARSELAVPLKVGEQVIGVLDVQSSQPDAFSPIDERLLTTFAERAALALENARLYQESQRQQAEAIALYEATQPVPSPDLTNVLETVAERASTLTGLSRCTIILLDSKHKTAHNVAVQGYSEKEKQALLNRVYDEQSNPELWPQLYENRQPAIITDLATDPRLTLDKARPHMEGVALIVPLIVGDRLIGGLQVSGETQPLPQEWVRLVETFAAQAAILIENARLYNAVQEYARSLQIAAAEKEQLLEQLQKHAENLEQEVAARTADIFAEKEKVETILKSAGDAIVISDTRGHIDFVNDAFVELTGYSVQELINQQVHQILVTEQTPPATAAEIQRATSQGISWRGDIYAMHKDGHTLECDLTLAPVHDENGQLINYVGSLRDVSKARALERAKSEFLTNVSHQLRTPVTNLRTYAYLLDKGSTEKKNQYAQTVQDEIEKLLRLIQDLIEVVELDAGPIVANWRLVSPDELVNTLVARCQPRAQAAGLTLRAETPDEPLPQLLGSKGRLAQMLTKIMDNALNFTEEGEIVIGARLADSTESGAQQVLFWISDTGPGISSNELGQIYDRFFRGDAARPGHIVGTGLGLSVAQMIAEAHSGRIDVQSEPGQGSTFEVWLPVPTHGPVPSPNPHDR